MSVYSYICMYLSYLTMSLSEHPLVLQLLMLFEASVPWVYEVKYECRKECGTSTVYVSKPHADVYDHNRDPELITIP